MDGQKESKSVINILGLKEHVYGCVHMLFRAFYIDVENTEDVLTDEGVQAGVGLLVGLRKDAAQWSKLKTVLNVIALNKI